MDQTHNTRDEHIYLTISAAAEYLSVNPNTLIRWEQRGLIAPRRTPGGHRRYSVSDLEDVLTSRIRTERP